MWRPRRGRGARMSSDREAPRAIPLFDLERQNVPILEDLLTAVAEVARAQSFVLGSTVADFESAVSEYLDVEHAIGVASGTDALHLSLRLLELEPGDEVITSPFTFFATAGAIVNAGGRPVFADIDPDLQPRPRQLETGGVSDPGGL